MRWFHPGRGAALVGGWQGVFQDAFDAVGGVTVVAVGQRLRPRGGPLIGPPMITMSRAILAVVLLWRGVRVLPRKSDSCPCRPSYYYYGG